MESPLLEAMRTVTASLRCAAIPLLSTPSNAEIILAENGTSDFIIATQPGATAAEVNAAKELAKPLERSGRRHSCLRRQQLGHALS